MARRFRIGPWVAEESSDRLVSADSRVKLERRAMATLLLLAENAGQVVSRERILEQVWSGLHVSDHSVAIVISDLRRALGDERRQPTFIETIPKRGYRLLAPVERLTEAPVVAARQPMLDRRALFASAAVGFVALGAAGLWAFGAAESKSEASTIFVEDIQGPERGPAPDHVEFALGDMITTTLAELPAVSVIRLRAGQQRPAAGGRIVSGRTLAQGDNRLAMIQVSDSASGELLWARTYVISPSRLAPRSVEIAGDVARALGLESPATRLARVGPEAHERYWRARYLWDRRTHESIRAARQILEALVADEPGFAAAYAALADIYAHKSGEELGIPRLDTFAAARRHLRTARSLGPATSEIFVTEALLSFYADRDYRAARAAAQRAVELAPGRPASWQTLAMVESATGSREAALAAIERARTLDPGSGSVAWDRAWHLFVAGRQAQALAAAEEARRTGQSVSLLLALIRGAEGRTDAAFEAWLQRSAEAGAGAEALAAARIQPDRRAAYAMLAEAVAASARPRRPVIVALLFMQANRPAEAARSLGEAERGRSDWMTAWVPRMREFASLRSGRRTG